MTKQDLIDSLGTVAKSGTTQFVEKMAAGADLNMIGQFGVGFYSVYLVADRVVVRSKNDEDVQHIWESSADATFRVGEDPAGNTLGRGTEITLYLKDDAKEYLDADKLEGLIKKYSEFITFPIYLYKSHTETVEVPVEEEEEEDVFEGEDLEEEGSAEEVEEEQAEAETPKTRTEEKTVWDWELMNPQKAIWSRDKSEISDEEYKNFYKTLVRNSEQEPLTWTHFKAEGEIDFKCILYLPRKAAADLYEDFYHKKMENLHLYVRKVLIQDSFDDLLPRYLSFVVGVVDSDDLPLNVSREQLSQDKVLKVMGKKIVRKAIEMIKKLAEEEGASEEAKEQESAEPTEPVEPAETTEAKPEDNPNYIELWEQFGKSLKIGVIEDSANRNKLARLLRYKSTLSDDKWTSLEHYVERMKDWQKQIYFVSGDSIEKVKNSMFLETFKRRGVEVLYFTDPIDEYVVQNLREFNGKTLQDITKEGVEFGDEKEHAKKLQREYDSRFDVFTNWMKELLGDKVDKVQVSMNLETAPAVLTTSKYGYSATMERIMKSQALQNPEKAKYMKAHKIMEVNPRHPIIINLKNLVEEDPESDVARDFANLLYDSSLMNSGFIIEEPNEFAGRLYTLMKESLQIDSLELEPEIELPEEETEENDSEEEEEEEDENSVKFDMGDSEQMDEDEFRAQLKKDRAQNDDDDEL
jgi:heat shock protein beta